MTTRQRLVEGAGDMLVDYDDERVLQLARYVLAREQPPERTELTSPERCPRCMDGTITLGHEPHPHRHARALARVGWRDGTQGELRALLDGAEPLPFVSDRVARFVRHRLGSSHADLEQLVR